MRNLFKPLAALSPISVVAGLAGVVLLPPAALAQWETRGYNLEPDTSEVTSLPGHTDWLYRTPSISDEQMAAFFEQLSEEMDRLNTLAPAETRHAERLAKLTEGLDSHDGLALDIRAYLLDDIYAFALGNGAVRVTSGLLDALNDDEVRCVIGQQIGQVRLGHRRQSLLRALYSDTDLTVAGADRKDLRRLVPSKLGRVAQQVVYARHTRANLRKADDYALAMMTAQGYDRKACATAWEKLAVLRGGGNDIALLQTHSYPTARAKRIRMQVE